MAYEESCETCLYMNEDAAGPHCANCTHCYTSEYRRITNRGYLRLLSSENVARVIVVDKPYCDPIMGDMVCGTAKGCEECLTTWLDREKEDMDASLSSTEARE